MSVATGPPRYQLRAVLGRMGSATGLTIPHIAAAPLIRTEPRQIGLAAALAAIHLPTAKPAPDNKSLDRADNSAASLPQAVVSAAPGET